MTPETDNPNEPTNPEPQNDPEAAPPVEGLSPEEAEEAALEEEFASLLDQHLPGAHEEASRGEPMDLPIVAIREDSVLVDMGGKAEASIPREEFATVDGELTVKVGDIIPVLRMKGTTSEGLPRLSHREARFRQARKNVKDAYEQKVPLRGLIKTVVKGGVMVDVGIDGFMPASQVDLFKVPDLNKLVGMEIEAYVIEYDGKRNRAVLSRRQLLYERREAERSEFIKTLEPGQTIVGKVKNSLDFGTFVDLGMVDGFIPREELSWDRGKSPGEVMQPGEEVELKILNVSADSGKITLSRKRLTHNPWEDIEQRYPVGSTIKGTVVAIQHYGAFVHIEEGITGMIHAGDMSWSSGNKKPEDYVRVGDEVTSQILEVDQEKKRISLGLKQLARDPWGDIEERFQPNTRHTGTVTSLTNYGAFVKLDDYIEGMVHVSDMSWTKRVNHPKEVLAVNQEVEVVVLKTDRKNRRISLGMKQLADSPFDAFLKKNKVGSIVTGSVTRFAPFGAFVQLDEHLEGLIHISQIDEKRVELPEHVLKPGQEVTVKIIGADKKNGKISLSRKEAIRAAEKETVKKFLKQKDDQPSGMSLGDALRQAQERDTKDQ